MGPLVGLLAGIALTLVASALFTEAAERVGEVAGLERSFMGSVIAPLFTSSPELAVLLVSTFAYGGEAGVEVGSGTVLGEPFAVSTLGIPLLTLSALLGSAMGRRRPAVEFDRGLELPCATTLAVYPLVALPAFVSELRIPVAASLVLAYVAYAMAMYGRRAASPAERAPAGNRGMVGPAMKLAASVPLLLVGSYLMVGSASKLSADLGMSTLSLSILIVPLATALPEIAASLIWAYRGSDTLALGALVGEMVMMSTIFPALGMALTDWRLNAAAIASVAMTELASALTLLQARSGRLSPLTASAAVLYFAYVAIARALA
mgnify:CR=1 FL=1